MEVSEPENIFVMWFVWHFYEMPRFLFQVWKNYILFSLDYFSIFLLSKTLFSPWRRYKWKYPRGFDIQEFFSTFVSNFFSRFLGATCRIVLIVIGIIFQILVLLAGFFVILFWFLIPLIIIAGVVFIFII